MPYFFQQAFASAGDKSAIPVAVQPDGSVSYNQGFGFDYSRDKSVDPLAKDVPREATNQLFFAITDNLNTWQLNAAPLFVEPAENGGVPVSYRRGAMVTWRASPGDPYRTYLCLTDGATSTPATAADWQQHVFQAALNADTTSTDRLVTPAYVTARLAGLSLTVPAASTTQAGISEYATDAETIAGVIADRSVTVTGLAATALSLGWARAATTSVSGRVQLADNSVTAAFSAADRAVTPAGLGFAIPAATTSAVGRVRLATLAEANAQSLGTVAVPPNALTGYARLNQNVSFTLAQSSAGFDVTSSRKVKCDLTANPYGLDDVRRIATAVGRYRQDYVADRGRKHVFLLAEQLAEIIPEAVTPDGAEYRGERVPTVNYDMLVPVLVKALQEERDRRLAGTLVAGGLALCALVAAVAALIAGG
jgi:hypothetical protein